MPFASILRFAPWLALFAIAVLSLVPGEARPHTGMPGQAEHFLAYFLTALVLGIRVGTSVYCIPTTLALCAYAGAMEILQIWIPGRNAQFIDFAASSFGAFSGSLVCILTLCFLHWSKRRRLGDIG
jgi:VanZ family protein